MCYFVAPTAALRQLRQLGLGVCLQMAAGIREELNALQFPFAGARAHLWHVPRAFYDQGEVFPGYQLLPHLWQ